MRLRLAALLTAPFALALPAVHAQTTVKSLDQVRDVIQTDAAKQMFDQQMSGKPAPDGFGTALPAGFTADFLLRQLAPGQPADRLVLAGAKPWPQRERAYVGVVCLAASAEAAAQSAKYSRNECVALSGSDGDQKSVWFGVFETGADGAPALVARTETPVSVETDWEDSNIDPPIDLAMQDASKPMLAAPQSWKRFDLARYQIRPDETAFGVRAGWSEGYSGGGADFEALYLFRIEGRALRVVFAQPMAFYKMLAGDWNPDGTREHIESDASNTLSLLPGKTDGYFDIQLRQQKGVWKQTLKWSAARQRYE